MCVNAVAYSVMLQLYLRHDFYNIIFKIKYKLYRASGSGPAQMENSGCASGQTDGRTEGAGMPMRLEANVKVLLMLSCSFATQAAKELTKGGDLRGAPVYVTRSV